MSSDIRQALLPAELRDVPELRHPGGTVRELPTWCGLHGEQPGAYCRSCDAAYGIDRMALANEQRVRALAEELRSLGIDVGPIKALGDKMPGPNESVPVMSTEEKKQELLAQLRALGVSG
jgi:hypothetical protein